MSPAIMSIKQPELRPKPNESNSRKAKRSSLGLSNGITYTNAVYFVPGNSAPSTLEARIISLIYYCFAQIRPDGTVTVDEEIDVRMPVDGLNGYLQACKKLKEKNAHLNVVLSVGGRHPSEKHFSEMAKNANSRQRFAMTCRDIVDRFDLDGIDIFWEHPRTVEDGDNFIELLRAVRAYLPASTYLVTAALPAHEWLILNIPNISRANDYVDLWNLIAFDLVPPFASTTGHQSQLYSSNMCNENKTSCFSAMKSLIQLNLDLRKVLLGVPLYGRSFLGATRIDQGFEGWGGNNGVYLYSELPLPNTSECLDQSAGAVYLVDPNGAGFVSYDNPSSVAMKADFVCCNSMAGLFFFEATGDHKGERSLIKAGFCGLQIWAIQAFGRLDKSKITAVDGFPDLREQITGNRGDAFCSNPGQLHNTE